MGLLNNKDVGIRLLQAREKTSLTSRKYALKAGIDVSQYAKIEKGELPVTENILEKLKDAFGLEPDYIKFGTIVPKSDKHTEEQRPYGDAGRKILELNVPDKDKVELLVEQLGLMEVTLLGYKNLVSMLQEENTTLKSKLSGVS